MPTKSRHPPNRDSIPSLESLGVTLHPDTLTYVGDSQALADAIGGNGKPDLKDIFRSWVVFLAAFSASMGGLLFGFDQGILSIVYVMPRFLADIPEVDPSVSSSAGLNKGVMTGLLELGALLGAVMAGFIADKYSRKRAIAYGAVWFVFGSTIQAACQNYGMLTAGRFFGGIGVGVLSCTAPMYISEISPPNIRGALLALEGSTIVIGIVIMFYITYGSRHIDNEWCYRLPFTIQMVPVFALGVGMWKLPYSPRWLVMVGRDQEALESLVRLRGFPMSDPRIQAEWIVIRGEALRNREVVVKAHPAFQSGTFMADLKLETAAWLDMFKPGLVQRTIIGIFLMLFQQFQGINALIYYSPTLFGTLGLDTEMQITMSGVLNVIQMVATCSAFFLLDRIGRKPPLIIGSIGNLICHSVTAAMIGKYSYDWGTHSQQAWVGVGFILAFMFFFGLGWSPVPWAVPAEVQNSSRRAKGVAISVCANWFFNFIIGLITPPMIEGISWGTFVFFGAFSFASLVYVWFFLPETKGMSLEELDDTFKDKSAHEEVDAKREIIRLILAGERADASASSDNLDDKNAQIWVEGQSV